MRLEKNLAKLAWKQGRGNCKAGELNACKVDAPMGLNS